MAKPLQLTLPLYTHSRRGRPLIGLGLWFYDRLARSSHLPPHIWLDAATAAAHLPELKPAHMRGLFSGRVLLPRRATAGRAETVARILDQPLARFIEIKVDRH